MFNQHSGIIVTLIVLTFAFLSPTFRHLLYRLILGKPNLRLEELPAIFSGKQSFQIGPSPREMPGADKSLQAYSGRVSVIYHVTNYNGKKIETVDIAYPGRLGMILTLCDGEVAVLERIGGRTIENPDLPLPERNAVTAFMRGVHDCFAHSSKASEDTLDTIRSGHGGRGGGSLD